MCPECGTAVRATILYNVDPHAEEFQPLTLPRLTSVCLVTWPAGALLAALASWAMRGSDIAAVMSGSARGAAAWGGGVMLVGVLISGLSLIGLVRPSRGTSAWKGVAVVLALACYAPLAWTVHAIATIDAGGGVPYFGPRIEADRVLLHMVQTVCFGAILGASRPVARELVKRSLAMRTGRVDRQTILAMIAVCALMLVGDAMRWASIGADMPQLLAVGTLTVAISSLFLTLGLGGAVVDGWRIALAIRSPAPGLRQVIGGV